MRAITFAASLLMAGSAFAGSSVVTYTPSQKDPHTATYINARIIRVNPRASTITFRSESRDVVLTVEGDALSGLDRVRAGDDVLLGYRLTRRGGREVRIVNAIKPADVLVVTGSTSTRGTVTTFPVVTPSRYEPIVVTEPVAVAPAPTGAVVLSAPVVNAVGNDAGAIYADAVVNASPYNRQIPSLPPPTVERVNVVPPSMSAPALPGSMPVGASRAVALRDYDNQIRMLSAKAGEIDTYWARYRDICLNTTGVSSPTDRTVAASTRDRGWFAVLSNDVPAPGDDQCRQLLVELNRMASDWSDAMANAESAGRAYDVLPGEMREARQRYRVDF